MCKPPNLDEMKAIARKIFEERRASIDRWGTTGPPVNVLAWGKRLVASHNALLEVPADYTYHDFLEGYIIDVFGDEWWCEELKKAEVERHQVVAWYVESEQFRRQASAAVGAGNVLEISMPPASAHLLRLSFDLHQIKHLGILQQSLVKRLKVLQQFQGARYEVAVSAAFVRAGFSIALEPEGKGPNRLCEFVATHLTTGKTYAVEAKSRHIAGVLGQPAVSIKSARDEPNVRGLVRDALGKEAQHDRIVCIDVNYPEPVAANAPSTWGKIVGLQIDRLEAEGHGPTLLIFTNAPFHYLPADAPAQGAVCMIMGLREPRFVPADLVATTASFPGLIDVGDGFRKGVPGCWE